MPKEDFNVKHPKPSNGCTGWALEAVLLAADFTQHASKTVRGAFFAMLRDAWQMRPAMHVSAAQLGHACVRGLLAVATPCHS